MTPRIMAQLLTWLVFAMACAVIFANIVCRAKMFLGSRGSSSVPVVAVIFLAIFIIFRNASGLDLHLSLVAVMGGLELLTMTATVARSRSRRRSPTE
jgi:hypothetical protein